MYTEAVETVLARAVVASLSDAGTIATTYELADALGLVANHWDSPMVHARHCAALIAGWLAVPVDRAKLAEALFALLNDASGEMPLRMRRVAP